MSRVAAGFRPPFLSPEPTDQHADVITTVVLGTSPEYCLNLEFAYCSDLLHTWPLRRKEKRP